MSWEKPRPSILQRPRKSGTCMNVENYETEWTKDQKRIQAKRERLQEIDDRLRVANGGATATDKQRLNNEFQKHANQVIQTKNMNIMRDKQREKELTKMATQSEHYVMSSEDEARRQKRAIERQTMEENIRLSEQRRAAAMEQKRREQEAERRNAEYLSHQPLRYR
eukprot:TRINITY_DN3058_c1_g1_i3.p1 TRINITY_DN3058_c1_g1~~TRINITY_DN3058_c1_g1_i3.p1  ORF type:complete len:181 (+),score=33.20 TRINITY_DN3058_c1_g1_i3:47-544(+)